MKHWLLNFVHTSYSLNSLKGIVEGTTIGVIKEDTRSLDYSSYICSSQFSKIDLGHSAEFRSLKFSPYLLNHTYETTVTLHRI